jgi:hypothetical protein
MQAVKRGTEDFGIQDSPIGSKRETTEEDRDEEGDEVADFSPNQICHQNGHNSNNND